MAVSLALGSLEVRACPFPYPLGHHLSLFFSSPHFFCSPYREGQIADHIGLSESQVLSTEDQTPGTAVKSLESVSTESTLINIDSEEQTLSEVDIAKTLNGAATGLDYTKTPNQLGDTEMADHLPEPPASPQTSNDTLISLSSTSTVDEPSTHTLAKTEVKTGKTPSANRLSISYAGGNRRLLVDAEVVESLKVFRQEGRIEVVILIDKEGQDGLKGILVSLSSLLVPSVSYCAFRLRVFQISPSLISH